MAWSCQSCTLISRERVFFMKKTLLFLGIVLSMLTVCAEENVLQTIEIIPVKDTYNIVLTADRSVDVKKTVQAPNKITLDMKGIRASKTLNTVYNNASNVDTVMVEPNGNGITLFFQAENAAGASVSFDSIAPVIIPKTKNVKLSNPIESYAPIYNEEPVQEKTSELFKKLFKKSNDINEEFDDASSPAETAHKFFSYGLVGLLAFAVIRLFKKKEPEMQIGLSQSLNDREIDMYRGAQPIGVSYQNSERPFRNVNYGINAYQKENRNPYEPEFQIHNPRLQNYRTGVMPRTSQAVTQPMPQRTAVQTAVKPALKKQVSEETMNTSTQTNPNVDNLKFLESMTAIYEKSGRHDLAQGLKASLGKTGIK